MTLDIGGNNVGDGAADDIAAALKCITQLERLDISKNNLQTNDVLKIAIGLQKPYHCRY